MRGARREAKCCDGPHSHPATRPSYCGASVDQPSCPIEAEARANASEMMVAIFVMMFVGILLAIAVRSLQSYLLRWQPQFEHSA